MMASSVLAGVITCAFTWVLLIVNVSAFDVTLMFSVLPAPAPPVIDIVTPKASLLMSMVLAPAPVVIVADGAFRVPDTSIVLPEGSSPSMVIVVKADMVESAESVTLPTSHRVLLTRLSS